MHPVVYHLITTLAHSLVHCIAHLLILQVYSAEPILGVQFTVEDVARPLKDMTILRK